MLDIAPIKARLAAATPGPWMAETEASATVAPIAKVGTVVAVSASGRAPNPASDVALIVTAPTSLAALVAEVERLRAAIASHKRRVVIDPQPWDRDLWAVLQ